MRDSDGDLTGCGCLIIIIAFIVGMILLLK
jgi:hypothetical protein